MSPGLIERRRERKRREEDTGIYRTVFFKCEGCMESFELLWFTFTANPCRFCPCCGGPGDYVVAISDGTLFDWSHVITHPSFDPMRLFATTADQ